MRGPSEKSRSVFEECDVCQNKAGKTPRSGVPGDIYVNAAHTGRSGYTPSASSRRAVLPAERQTKATLSAHGRAATPRTPMPHAPPPAY